MNCQQHARARVLWGGSAGAGAFSVSGGPAQSRVCSDAVGSSRNMRQQCIAIRPRSALRSSQHTQWWLTRSLMARRRTVKLGAVKPAFGAGKGNAKTVTRALTPLSHTPAPSVRTHGVRHLSGKTLAQNRAGRERGRRICLGYVKRIRNIQQADEKGARKTVMGMSASCVVARACRGGGRSGGAGGNAHTPAAAVGWVGAAAAAAAGSMRNHAASDRPRRAEHAPGLSNQGLRPPLPASCARRARRRSPVAHSTAPRPAQQRARCGRLFAAGGSPKGLRRAAAAGRSCALRAGCRRARFTASY